jgi:hypothetical protein
LNIWLLLGVGALELLGLAVAVPAVIEQLPVLLLLLACHIP